MSITMTRRWFTLGPSAVLALALLAACGGGGGTNEPAGGDTEGTTVPAVDTVDDTETTGTDTGTTDTDTDTGTPDTGTDATDAGDGDATPMGEGTPGADGAMATPMGEGTPGADGAMATPMAEGTPGADGAMATPMGEGTPGAASAMATPIGEGTPGATPGATPAADATPESAAGDEAAQEFTVTSYDIYFEPDEFTIPADTDVRVLLPNEGAAPHNFSIDDKNNPDVPNLGISVDQAPSTLDYETTINAPAGRYYFYCNVPGHEQAGMVGYMNVE
jgi:hypothetical protein